MIFRREPAAILNVVSAAVALVVAFGWFDINDTKGQAIIAVVSAITTAWLAFHVRPLTPTLLTGLVTSGVAFLAAFDILHITARETGLIVAFAEVLLTGIIIRPQSTPVADARPPTHAV